MCTCVYLGIFCLTNFPDRLGALGGGGAGRVGLRLPELADVILQNKDNNTTLVFLLQLYILLVAIHTCYWSLVQKQDLLQLQKGWGPHLDLLPHWTSQCQLPLELSSRPA